MLMGVGADRTQVIKGLVLLAAVAFDVFNKQQGRPSIMGRLFPARESVSVNGEPKEDAPKEDASKDNAPK
jgi:putative multiple sugar transport system permease protein